MACADEKLNRDIAAWTFIRECEGRGIVFDGQSYIIHIPSAQCRELERRRDVAEATLETCVVRALRIRDHAA